MMVSFDKYLDEHAAELFRAQLFFAFLIIAVGCGIAIHGASTSRQVQAALLGETSSVPFPDAIFGLGKLPIHIMDLSDRYGESCDPALCP